MTMKPYYRPSCFGLLAFLSLMGASFGQPTANPPRADVEAHAKAFVERLAKRDFANAVQPFDATMRRVVSQDKLQVLWDGLVRDKGVFKQQTETILSHSGVYTIAYVTCAFDKGSLDIKVVFDSKMQIAGLFFVPPGSGAISKPPSYARPDDYQEVEVVVGSLPWRLPGTLTLPRRPGQCPAVVLVHGSGPNDRDETVGAILPFRDLACGLASQGIAVLRYEKRTKAHPLLVTLTLQHLTVKEETIDDCLAAVALLRQRNEIAPERVFVLGHSLGGMLIPRIGLSDTKIAGLIVLAGTTRPLEDVILEQIRYLTGSADAATEDAKARLEQTKRDVAKVKDLKPSDASTTQLLLGAPPAYWLDLRGYRPAEAAGQLEQPLLILQGERDYQVTVEDFRGWCQALSSRPSVTLKSYPKLNHLFVEGEGRCMPSEYEKPGHVDVRIVKDIADWIHKQEPPRANP